jgi:hypothetical protein
MIIKEQYPHAVAATFSDEQHARRGITALLHQSGLKPKQVMLLQPGDRHLSRKVEPESGGIFRTLLSAHLWAAIVGFIGGIAAALLMIQVGPSWAADNPAFTPLAFAWVGTLSGAMIGGFITLRPDREGLRMAARQSSDSGEWTVLVHCESLEEKSTAESQLDNTSTKTAGSL